MDTFEKALLALENYILGNKERVASDLEEMRKKSEGNDIFNYVESLSYSLSYENVSTNKEVTYNFDFLEVDTYSFINDSENSHLYAPPCIKNNETIKKSSEILSELFF